MHSVRSLRKSTASAVFPGNPAIKLSSIRETHAVNHLCLGMLRLRRLPTLAYPLQNVLAILYAISRFPTNLSPGVVPCRA